VAALGELPRTKHDAGSFLVDVPFFNNSLIIVVVNGVYRELIKKQYHTRAFTRNFSIIPQGGGFVIINDVLLLTNATASQMDKYGKLMACTDTPMASVGSLSSAMDLPPDAPPDAHSSSNQSLVQSFSARTGMNAHFSDQCLQENNYNFEASLAVFEKLSTQGLIPPEAFRP
jgi:nuclear RNA export factor